jgi:glycosyltransferase involved in cell wall biosynthesis
MKISVVVCTRDRHETIGEALESIAACEYPSFDIHVMDQSTNDLTRQIVLPLADKHQGRAQIHYHHLDKAGLSRSYNRGMAVSDGEIIAFTDDDCIVPSDWLSRIAKNFTDDPELGLLYGQVLIPASLMPEAMKGTLIVPDLHFEKRERLSKKDGFKVFGMGANMAIRRSLLDLVAGFDEALGGGGPLRSAQDYDFAYRAYRFGSAILLDPEVKADHYGTRTPDQWPVTMQNYGIGDGAFYAKHMRCGDLLAYRLFIKQLVRSWGREVKHLVRHKRTGKDMYGRFLVEGVRQAKKFAIDKKYRLYRETDKGKMVVTQANVVTAARPETGAE